MSSISMSSYSHKPVVGHREPSGRHEATRGERRQSELVGTSLGHESPRDDGEGAFGLGVVGGGGEREMHPQTMVPAGIAESCGDPHHALFGAQLHGGGDLHGFLARCGAREKPSMWSGHRYCAVITATARRGPRSSTRTDTLSGVSTSWSVGGGE